MFASVDKHIDKQKNELDHCVDIVDEFIVTNEHLNIFYEGSGYNYTLSINLCHIWMNWDKYVGINIRQDEIIQKHVCIRIHS